MSPVAAEAESLCERAVSAGEWRDAVGQALREGRRFAGLWASPAGDGLELRAAFGHGGDLLSLSCRAGDASFPSIVEVVPAAEWDEREAHDLYGAAFESHAPLRPLVAHPAQTAEWAVPVRGADAFQVAVGPIHAGVIESGHFRFHVVGERVLHLDLRLFYKHRGLEVAAEGRSPEQALPFVQRACAGDAVANAVAFAQACEAAQGLWPEPALSRERTLLAELERLYNHLNDIAAICAGVGFAPANMLFAAFKERAQRLNSRLSGHRFLFDAVRPGGSGLDVERSRRSELRADLRVLEAEVVRGWRELQFAGSAQDRFEEIGALALEDASRLGAVGPAARASGLALDARRHSPRLSYEEFSPAAPPKSSGDVAARLEMRGAELPYVFARLDELLGSELRPGAAEPFRTPARHGTALVESPRGQTLCAVTLGGGRVERVHLRTGSYANWPALARAVRDCLLPDFPLVNKSFELCYACVDR
jgi:Ni,Fe-hydrogenase III large subunit